MNTNYYRTPATVSTRFNKGFTLIELLVVVLIIGILASVSLPQYTKAVEKSRATNALVLGKAIKDASERFYLENNQYPDSVEELDIEFTCPDKHFTCEYRGDNGQEKISIIRNKPQGSGYYSFVFGFDHRAAGLAGLSYCFTLKDDAEGNALCRTFSTTPVTAYTDDNKRYQL